MERTTFLPAIFILLISILLLVTHGHGQLRKIENKLPKSVPLEIEFKNFDQPNWWQEFHIKATNTGSKPIYYLWLILWLDVKDMSNGRRQAISFKFGDSKFYPVDREEIASSNDTAILPGESYTLKVSPAQIKMWDLLRERNDFVLPKSAELDHGGIRFGDGTGLESGGSPLKKKI